MKVSLTLIRLIVFTLFCLTVSPPTKVLAQNGEAESGTYTRPADPTRFPYIVSIRSTRGQGHLCNGVLVGNRTVITAAHCMDVRQSALAEPNPEVWIGTFSADELDRKIAVSRKVVKFRMHPLYKGNRRRGFDIAALQLDEATNNRPIRMLSQDFLLQHLIDSEKLAFLGFGRISASSAAAPVLQIGFVKYINNTACNAKYFNGAVTDSMLCAGETEAGLCVGDDGAPLFIQGAVPARDLLVGVASILDRQCGRTAPKPSVYAPIFPHADFLDKMKDEFDVPS